jgi:hypothetical protein
VWVDTSYVVPSGGGTITSFSFQSDSSNKGQALDFLVLRPMGENDFVVVGKRLVMLTGPTPPSTTKVETFSADIRVQGGDVLGFWGNAHDDSVEIANCAHDRVGGGFPEFEIGFPDPNIGDTITPSGDHPPGHFDLNESATLVPAVSLPPPPTSKQQCEHGGWRNFGSRFKNQGQCVSLVEHQHHKHHPSG